MKNDTEQESKIKQMFALAFKDDRYLDEYSIVTMDNSDESGKVKLWLSYDVHSYTISYRPESDCVWCKYHHQANSGYTPWKIYNIRKVIALIEEIIKESMIYIVQIYIDGGYLADWEGDPGRTLKLENASIFERYEDAEIALSKAREYRTLDDARILPYEDM